MAEILVTIGLMIIGACIAALLARLFRQPLLLGYVIAGAVIGPLTHLVTDQGLIASVSELGLIFLMFIIGLELDLSKMKDVGRISVAVGLLQVLGTMAIATLLAWLLGFAFIPALYLGLVIAFSSTIVVVKILTDINEISSQHGELVLGILVIQDIIAVLGLTLLGTLGGSEAPVAIPTIDVLLEHAGITLPQTAIVTVAALLVHGAAFALITYLFFRYAMPFVFRHITLSNELLFVSSLAVVFVISALAGFFQFSFAIGAFAAGIALSSAVYSHEIMGRMLSLRDFFLILFFVGLGMQLTFTDFASQYALMGLLFAGALVIKPIVTFFVLKLFKYNNRTAFLASVHLAQIGEFGLILVSAGVFSGALPAGLLTGAVIVTIITMTLTAYVIEYDERLYQLFRPLIRPTDLVFGTRPEEVRNVPEKYRPEIVVFGATPLTEDIITDLHGKRRMLLVDHNPARVLQHKERGVPTVCSDATNIDLYESIDFSRVETVVSAIHEPQQYFRGQDTNMFIIKKLRSINPKASIIVSSGDAEHGKRLYNAGATIVLTPQLVGRRVLSQLLAEKNAPNLRRLGAQYFAELQRIRTGRPAA